MKEMSETLRVLTKKGFASVFKRLGENDLTCWRLELHCNLEISAMFGCLAQFIECYKDKIKNLREISVWCRFGSQSTVDQFVARIIRCNLPCLRALCFQDMKCNAIMEALATNFNIESLTLKRCLENKKDASQLCSALVSGKCEVKNVHLHENHLDDGDYALIAENLIQNSKIKKFSLSYCRINGKVAAAIADALQSTECSIECLDLSHNGRSSNEACLLIASALNHNFSIKHINFSECGIGSKSVAAIADALQSTQCVIENINLSHNEQVSFEGFKALSDSLFRNSTLKKLDLSHCNICDEGFTAIMNSLYTNSSLQVLVLGLLIIDDKRADVISDFLQGNTSSLRILDFGSVYHGQRSFVAIANALPFNTHLVQLKFTSNGLTEEVWRAFHEALCRNFVLQELGNINQFQFQSGEVGIFRKSILTNMSLNKELGPVISEVTRTNFFPRRLLRSLDEDSMSSACYVEAMCKILISGKLSAIFELVQERPTLFNLSCFLPSTPPTKPGNMEKLETKFSHLVLKENG